ncbi:MAG: efflux RND transporter periplasmic adaptor subunit [Deltaproteobacteria bacterium]|nr:efflux RND transporter periplasmic adaptor subunit [Deltaproteobacteria bacterium]
MKKLFFAIFLTLLLIGSFLGGAWTSRHGTAKYSENERRILNYVDPMNPVNVSDKPGIAPCGMPMEPVYDSEESAGQNPPGTVFSMSPGTVKVTPQNQQIIGVQVGVVERLPGTYEIRALGRITPDENRVYPLIAATDGWTGDTQGNTTTGTLVKKNQLMAQIKIYSYDFFTWQQRYLTELANRGQRRHPNTPTEARQTGILQPGVPPRTAAPQSGAAQPDGTPDTAPQPEPDFSEAPFPGTKESEASQPNVSQPEIQQPKGRLPALTLGLTKRLARDPLDDRADSALYVNKSKLELLNLGVGEVQLEELAQTAQYVSTIELRSPVNGLVISRGISSHQRVDRGTECFRVADISHVWIVADIFNAEAQYIRPGTSARISVPGQSKHYEARVSDILPKFDATTRTLKVRLEMDNPKNMLLPDMFVDVDFRIPLPSTMTVPASAILDSGRKKNVFVALGDGLFEPRSVVTGWRFGDRVEIVEGLKPGEQIVTSGNFLIDSESRMRLASARLSGTPENDPSEKTPQHINKKMPEDKAGKSAPGSAEPRHD